MDHTEVRSDRISPHSAQTLQWPHTGKKPKPWQWPSGSPGRRRHPPSLCPVTSPVCPPPPRSATATLALCCASKMPGELTPKALLLAFPLPPTSLPQRTTGLPSCLPCLPIFSGTLAFLAPFPSPLSMCHHFASLKKLSVLLTPPEEPALREYRVLCLF